MRIVNKIEAKTPQMPRRKRVAAYARVSMESERLQHSLSAQISFYSSLIQSNPAWEYVGVYADNGITGTKADAREEFNRMIADCEAGKIDIVLTKSISRFARNTVDLLNTVRRLKELGVSVHWRRRKAGAFPRTAPGDRENGLQTERSPCPSSGSSATTGVLTAIWF